MGNSSSGIKETLYFKCKTINIGSRQNARLKTKNIIDIKIKDKEIIYKINKLLLKQSNFKNLNNPYFSKMKIKNIDKKLLSFLNRKDIKKKSITY